MKKFAIMMAAVAAIVMGSCDSTPTAKMENEQDSVSYAAGVVLGTNLTQMMQYRMGIDSAYIQDFIRGIKDGMAIGKDTAKFAYVSGMQMGYSIKSQQLKGLSQQLTGSDSVDYINYETFLAAYLAAAKGDSVKMQAEEANIYIMKLLESSESRKAERQFADNKKAGEAFMTEIAKKEGVKPLRDGVYYEVIQEGNGPVAADTSHVSLRYRGTLIDGTEFDKSARDDKDEPTTFAANQVIPGFSAALTSMPVGSKWKVYIPQEQAYGSRQAGQIKPFSALIFEIELVGIK